MTLKALIAACCLLVSSFGLNIFQFQRAVSERHKHVAESLKATVNAYVQASVISAQRQQRVDVIATPALDVERDALGKIIKARDNAIDKLWELNAKSNTGIDCRVDAERVRIVNEKLGTTRSG